MGEYEQTYSIVSAFISGIINDIKIFKLKNYIISKIEMFGYADGIKNYGVKDWSLVPSDCCIPDSTGCIYDYGLAYVRACILKKKILALFDNLPVSSFQPIVPKDIIDGGASGGRYRKVIIKITFSKIK